MTIKDSINKQEEGEVFGQRRRSGVLQLCAKMVELSRAELELCAPPP
jgi:hypothetical protein